MYNERYNMLILATSTSRQEQTLGRTSLESGRQKQGNYAHVLENPQENDKIFFR